MGKAKKRSESRRAWIRMSWDWKGKIKGWYDGGGKRVVKLKDQNDNTRRNNSVDDAGSGVKTGKTIGRA